MSQMSAKVELAWNLQDRLHKAMRISGNNATTIAAAIGRSRNTVNSYLSGKSPIGRPEIIAWAFATGVPVDWLLDGTVSPTEPDGDGVPQAATGDREAALAQLAAKKRGARHGVSDTHRYAA